MNLLALVFYIAALVLFLLASANVNAPPRLNLLSAGLACFTAATIIARLHP